MNPDPTLIPVFVYGTLRANQGNYEWALKGRTLSEDRATLTHAVMHDNGGFPFVALTGDTEQVVIGDLMRIDPDYYDRVMNDLDGLEGYHGPNNPYNMYDRALVTVTLDSGEQVDAYTYLVSDSLYEGRVRNLPVVASGDWVAHKAAQPVLARRW